LLLGPQATQPTTTALQPNRVQLAALQGLGDTGHGRVVLVPGLVDAPVLMGEVKPVHLAAMRS